MKKISSIYFGKSFFERLALHFTLQKSENLLKYCDKINTVIFLPTNRSILNLKKKMVDLSRFNDKPSFIPRMVSLSDIESMELFLVQYDENFVSQKTISSVKKFLFFLEKIQDVGSVKHKVEWSQYFCQFEDACAIAEISIDKVQHYVLSDYLFLDDDQKEFKVFKEVFRIFCDFMKELKDQNLLTQTTYRSLLSRRIANVIQQKFKGRVIVAGTTGTIPATRDLIKAVLNHEDGYVVLPGFDSTEVDEAIVEVTHPLHTMAMLVKDLKIDESQIECDVINERGQLIYQCYQDSDFDMNRSQGSRNLFLHAFDTLQEEAVAIVQIVRKLLNQTHYDISIITSNTQLMALLHCEFDLYDIKANFSSGLDFQYSPVGQYLSLMLDIIENPLDAKLWLYLFKHPLFLKDNRYDVLQVARSCELYLRTKVEFGKKTILEVFGILAQSSVDVAKNSTLEGIKHTIEAIQNLNILLLEGKCFTSFLDALKQVLKTSTQGVAFQNYDGKSLADFFDILSQNIRCSKSRDFIPYVRELMIIAPSVEDPTVYGSRVRILGTLESRSNIAEVVICASQNEGSWPKEPDIDPFINLSTKLMLGFPHPKRQQGLAAHDWCSNMYGEIVVLTRSKIELGQSKSYNRYWQRLLDLGIQEVDFKTVWQEDSSESKVIDPILPPSPKPVQSLRPLRYSASQLDRLLKDPYSFFVACILKLKPLKQLDERMLYVEKGILFHKILEDFLKIKNIQELTLKRLLAIASSEFEKVCFEDAPLSLIIWLERFKFIAELFCKKLEAEPVDFRKVECMGQLSLDVDDLKIEIHARYDRLEILENFQNSRVIDYKTGSLPTLLDIYTGKAVQILLQALLLDDANLGLNQDLNIDTIAELWQLQGTKEEPIKIVSLILNRDQKKEIQNAIQNLLSFFLNQNNPYLSCPTYDEDFYFSRKEEWQHQLRDETY